MTTDKVTSRMRECIVSCSHLYTLSASLFAEQSEYVLDVWIEFSFQRHSVMLLNACETSETSHTRSFANNVLHYTET